MKETTRGTDDGKAEELWAAGMTGGINKLHANGFLAVISGKPR